MAQKNPFADFFAQSDFSKIFENYQSNPFDLKALLETQRKNIQALTEANKIAVGNLQAIAQRQTEILSQIVEDNSSLAKEMMTEGTPEEKIAKNAKLFKNVYERTVGSMKELSEIINKSNEEASTIINKRVAATMNEIQSSLEKSQKKAA
ncbi:MAG: TIGR01841 family phasin [Alphaproteobacteria bacterium]